MPNKNESGLVATSNRGTQHGVLFSGVGSMRKRQTTMQPYHIYGKSPAIKIQQTTAI